MSRDLLQQALDALRQCEFTSPPAQRPIVKDAITALREALAAPQPEPVTWQFRWTNPGNKTGVMPYELEWREVVQTNSMHTIADAVADLCAYRFDGKPCYEVRPLFAAPPAATAPAVRDAEIATLRQYLDAAQRRTGALGDEVQGLREQVARLEAALQAALKGDST